MTKGRIAARLAELGIALPTPATPVANYLPFIVTGDLVVVSGQLPMDGAEVRHTGKLGLDLDTATGVAAARLCFVNVLAQLRVACGGDLDRVGQVVRLGGFIASVASFHDHAAVMNGASDLAVDVFGDAGRHARSTIGVAALPRDGAVEVEGMFRLIA